MSNPKESPMASLFAWLRKNKWVMASLTSIVFGLFCLLAVFYQNIELQKWNIPVGYAGDANGGRYFYVVVAGFVYFAVLPFMEVATIKIVAKPASFFRILWLRWKLVRMIKSSMKKANNVDVVEKINNLCPEFAVKKNFLKLSKVGWVIVKTFFLLLIVFYVPLHIIFNEILGQKVELILMILLSLVACMIVLFLLCWLELVKDEDINTISNRIHEKNLSIDDLLDMYNKIDKIESSLDKQSISTFAQVVTNFDWKQMRGYVLAAAISSPITVFLFFVSGINRFNQSYMIYVDNDNTEYALVYQEGDRIVLEGAEIDNDVLTIDTSHQIYTTISGKEMTLKSFKKVVVVE